MLKLFLICLLVVGFDCHKSFCGTDKLFKNMKRTKMTPIVTRKLTSEPRPFKIHMEYASLGIENLVSQHYLSNMKTLLTEVAEFFSELILSVDGDIRLNINPAETSHCYSRQLLFSQDVINGIYTDLIVVPVVSDELPESTVAAAGPCMFLHNNRPGLGIMYLGRGYDFSNPLALKYVKTVIAHEMMHILGFIGELFEAYPNPPKIITKTINGVVRTLISTPKILEIAKRHFGCNSIEGIEIENQGGEGSAGSHWEARTMLGDFMISNVYPEFAISEITLALLEDSGWYKVNYYTGGLFTFGKDQGCDFLNKPCYEGDGTRFPNDFCVPFAQRCFAGHKDRGNCSLFRYDEEIPEEYQYFDQRGPYVGGFEPADYCPVVYARINQGGQYYSTNCQNGILEQDSPDRDEVISYDSICVESSLDKNRIFAETRGTCYQVSCDFETLTFNITVGSHNITCGKDMTEEQTVEGYYGSLKCPKFARVCNSHIRCTDMFDCVEKKATNSWVISGQTYQKVSFFSLFVLLLAMII